ncbi:MAG: efflux RND transporter permease subunit, partial [Pedobacter sp.]
KPGINIGVVQLAGSNSNQIQIAIAKLMEKSAKNFPKGVKHLILYNTKNALDQSIDQVIHTLIEAFILVFIVVFIFLQDFRSTLIPAIAVPVAILGTFFFMWIFGFSINLLTLFALVLAIGIVVDDAIVVVEAVHAKMEHRHLAPKVATAAAMSEITGAIISITLVMSAVFLPVGFMEGSTGLFYRQFAFTLAIAIVISAVNALTLSPALAALFLKENHHTGAEKKTFKEKFFAGFNSGFEKITNQYTNTLRFLVRFRWLTLVGLVAVIILMGLSGFNMLTQSSSPSSGVIFVLLKLNDERGKIKDIDGIMNEVRGKLSAIKGANFFVFTFPTVPGFSNIDGLDMVLQDKTGGSLDKFSAVSNNFIAELMKRPEIAFAFTSFKSDYPQLEMKLDEVKAAQLGVSVKDILQTMQAYFGSAQASDFNRFGKYYRVVVQADKTDRANSAAMDGVFVKNKTGEMVPINTLVKLERVYGPETASRYNLFNSIGLNAMTKPGFSSGDAIRAVEEVAAKQLPGGYGYEFSGMTKEELSSGGQSAIIFI